MDIPIRNGGPSRFSIVPEKYLGAEELKRKMCSVFESICNADLPEEAKAFHDRIIIPALRNSDYLIECEYAGKNTFLLSFKPMAELLLLEIQYIASAPGFTESMRKNKIMEAFDLAGF